MAIRYYEVPETFQEWRIYAQYTLEDCQHIFKVTHRTVRNWETGKTEPPRAVFICLQLFSGRLDFLGKNWRGFRITPECIESPDGDFVRSWEIRALRYAMQALEIRRDRQCRMNENEKGIVEPLLREKAPKNVAFIDKAPKKKRSGAETKISNERIKKKANCLL